MRTGVAISVAVWLVIVVMCSWLAGCATAAIPEPEPIITTKVVDTGCDWAKPIYISKGDVLSDATAAQILEHDKTGAAKCGWKPTGKK